jgi:REP element-mobilizing transposase RayT
MRQSLRDIFAATLEKWGGTLLECHGEADHLHLLFEVLPTVQLSTCVNNLKTVSSATASAEGRFAPWRHCVGAGRPRPSSRLLRKADGPELARWYRQPVL